MPNHSVGPAVLILNGIYVQCAKRIASAQSRPSIRRANSRRKLSSYAKSVRTFASAYTGEKKDMAKILADTILALKGLLALREKRYMYYNVEVSTFMEFRCAIR